MEKNYNKIDSKRAKEQKREREREKAQMKHHQA